MGKYTLRTVLFIVALCACIGLAGCAESGAAPAATATAPASLEPQPVAPVATQLPVEPVTATRVPDTGDLPPTAVPTEPAPPAAETAAAPADAVSFPDPGAYEWREIVFGLDNPIGLAAAEDGSNRLFVVEKAGRIRIIQDGRLADAPFLDITDRVGSSGSEQGLLGLAFSPDYEQNGYLFVNYTDHNGNTVVSRFTRGGDANQADPGSEAVLLTHDQPYPNHNGGGVVFGPDGYLYLSLGDGGSAGDPQGNGQNVTSLLGKLLRIDVNQGDAYAIPADNPFVDTQARPEIWAFGLRNPWRFSFDRKTGDLYIADVGQNEWEEIDYLPAGSPGGSNFGWSYQEGTHPYKGNPPRNLVLVDPIYEYSHADGGCSVTGGYVYRGRMAEWQGIYLFGDYCAGNIWGLLPGGSSSGQKLWQLPVAISSFGQDEQGEVYLVNISGSILQLVKK